MSVTDKWYTTEETLVEIPKGRDLIRVVIGKKLVRDEPKVYLDIRTWYRDDEDKLCPGKGFAKPVTKEELIQIADALKDFGGRWD